MATRGLTLIELLVALAVLSITVTVAVPSFQALLQRNAVASTHNELLASLQNARQEALTRAQPVIVCNGAPSDGCDNDNGWEDGWYTAAVPTSVNRCRDADGDGRCDSHGGRIVHQHGPIADGLSLDGNGTLLVSRVRFQPSGMARGYAGTLSICDATASDVQGSGIVINVAGRIRRAEPGDLDC